MTANPFFGVITPFLVAVITTACTGQPPQSNGDGQNNTTQQQHVTERHFSLRVPVFEYTEGVARATGNYEATDIRVVNPTGRITFPGMSYSHRQSEAPARPLRYFGPFRSGSVLESINILVDGRSANWLYNNYFATIDPATEPGLVDVFRTYYRADLSNPNLASTVLPIDNSPALVPSTTPSTLSAADRAAGYARDLLLQIIEIDYSGAYGGSVKIELDLADIPTPNRGQVEPENFDYEFGIDQPGSGGGPITTYLFDANNLTAAIYVVPRADFINPVQGHNYSDVEVFVEFDPADYIAYKDGIRVSGAEVGDVLTLLLGSVGQAVASSLLSSPVLTRPHISLFTHAWIHDQHAGLISGPRDSIQRIFLADGWCDVVTGVRQPVVFAQWRVKALAGFENDGALQGNPEFRLGVRVMNVLADGSMQRIRHTRIELDEGETSRFMVISATDIGQECDDSNQRELRINLSELEPFPFSDTRFNRARVGLLIQCDALRAASASAPVPIVASGIIPVPDADGVVRLCRTPPGPLEENRSMCITDDGALLGTTGISRPPDANLGGVTDPPPIPIAAGRIEWEARVGISLR